MSSLGNEVEICFQTLSFTIVRNRGFQANYAKPFARVNKTGDIFMHAFSLVHH